MNSLRAPLLLAALVSCSLAIANDPLEPGQPAPKFVVGKWLKGKPITKLTKGEVYVVEFWATWCGPCKEAIPHLTELQKKFEGKATFVGVSVWETDETGIPAFLKDFGDKVSYALVRDKLPTQRKDRLDGAMADTWLKAAGIDGVPSTFLVDREGKIAWIGLPSGLEDPLAQVVAGTWDTEKFAKKFRAAKRGPAAVKECKDAFAANKWSDALRAADEALTFGYIEVHPYRYGALLKLGRREEAKAQGQATIEAYKMNWSLLEFFARTIAEPPIYGPDSDLELANTAIEKAVAMLEAWPTTTTLAHVRFLQGNKAQAIAILEKALSQMTSEYDKPHREKFEKRLAEYKKAVEPFPSP